MAPEVQSPARGPLKRPMTAHSAAREQGSRHGSNLAQPHPGGGLGDDLVRGWDDFKRQTGVLFLNRSLRAEPLPSGKRGVINVAVDDTAAAPQVSSRGAWGYSAPEHLHRPQHVTSRLHIPTSPGGGHSITEAGAMLCCLCVYRHVVWRQLIKPQGARYWKQCVFTLTVSMQPSPAPGVIWQRRGGSSGAPANTPGRQREDRATSGGPPPVHRAAEASRSLCGPDDARPPEAMQRGMEAPLPGSAPSDGASFCSKLVIAGRYPRYGVSRG